MRSEHGPAPTFVELIQYDSLIRGKILRCVHEQMARCPTTAEHAERVASMMALWIEENTVSEDMRRWGPIAAWLHDCGKATYEYRMEIDADDSHNDKQRLHTIFGYDWLYYLGLPPVVCNAVAQHHENWDGTGQPLNLRGAQIDEMARVIRLLDHLDVRLRLGNIAIGLPLGDQYDLSEIYSLLRQAVSSMVYGFGTQYDPALYNPFMSFVHAMEIKIEQGYIY